MNIIGKSRNDILKSKISGVARAKLNENNEILCMSMLCKSKSDCPHFEECQEYNFVLNHKLIESLSVKNKIEEIMK